MQPDSSIPLSPAHAFCSTASRRRCCIRRSAFNASGRKLLPAVWRNVCNRVCVRVADPFRTSHRVVPCCKTRIWNRTASPAFDFITGISRPQARWRKCPTPVERLASRKIQTPVRRPAVRVRNTQRRCPCSELVRIRVATSDAIQLIDPRVVPSMGPADRVRRMRRLKSTAPASQLCKPAWPSGVSGGRVMGPRRASAGKTGVAGPVGRGLFVSERSGGRLGGSAPGSFGHCRCPKQSSHASSRSPGDNSHRP